MLYKYELGHYMPVNEYFDILKLYRQDGLNVT